jgi:AraC family transcriptional regulator of adaptative response / DNA-3-methyladenine glycosylase II
MQLDADQCYRALRSHDARFDGRFFVGVATTGIYCRPVCPARTPRSTSCRFFPSAAAAEAGGFRPCLRCRPELAPGFAVVDATRRLAQAAARAIEDGKLDEHGLPRLAQRLGVTDRHLRRVFQQEFGVAPVEYAQTQRLLLAKRLLTDTRLPVLDVALASGFASLRRFNDLFRTRYRMTPGELRRNTSDGPAELLAFDIAYRPPYDWEAMLSFLERRAIEGVESVERGRYARTLRIGQSAGWIEVAPSRRKSALRVAVSASLAGSIPAVLARVKHLFDVACHPDEVAGALGEVANARPGLRLPGAADGFEVAVRAILGQQVTVRAAATLARRFAAAFGTPFETPRATLTRLFPTAPEVAALDAGDIAAQGIIAARARAIVALAQAVAGGRVVLEVGGDAPAAIEALRALPGIGPWTAEYVAMRALGWPDAFPPGDVAVMKAMGTKDARVAVARSEAWRPWRAYAVMHLWKSLEETK